MRNCPRVCHGLQFDLLAVLYNIFYKTWKLNYYFFNLRRQFSCFQAQTVTDELLAKAWWPSPSHVPVKFSSEFQYFFLYQNQLMHQLLSFIFHSTFTLEYSVTILKLGNMFVILILWRIKAFQSNSCYFAFIFLFLTYASWTRIELLLSPLELWSLKIHWHHEPTFALWGTVENEGQMMARVQMVEISLWRWPNMN